MFGPMAFHTTRAIMDGIAHFGSDNQFCPGIPKIPRNQFSKPYLGLSNQAQTTAIATVLVIEGRYRLNRKKLLKCVAPLFRSNAKRREKIIVSGMATPRA